MIFDGVLWDILKKAEHYEVYIDGNFFCSADNLSEAIEEVEGYLEEEEQFA